MANNNFGRNSYDNRNDKNQRNNGRNNNRSQEVLGDFFNPYSFVPLSKTVFTLTSEEQAMLQYCHDIPFKDSLSGCFDVIFKAVTPLCVGSRRETERLICERDGRKETVNKEVGKCPKLGDKYYVPGASIKGMIENVFRIITFGKIGAYIDNNRYSVRDLKTESEDYDLNKEGTKSGFLVKIRNDYYILPCVAYKRSFEEVEEKTKKTGINNALSDRRQSVRDKYNILGRDYSFFEGNKYFMWLISGHMDSKKHEHLFEINRTEINSQNLIPISETVWEEFLFIHERENENKSWSFWKKKLKNFKREEDIQSNRIDGFVPVFYRDNETGIRDFGFSRLYRQPYRKSIHDCLPENHKTEGEIDLAQAVFGYSNKHESLKGRVRFSHAICTNARELDPVFITPGSPKPSFYPFYLRQNSGSSQSTYGSNNAQIQGWKRFLLQKEAKPSEVFANSKIQSVFRPLQTGTQFTCRISYHNLRSFELGALLNAIDFFGEECFHSLGYAKPFGYGKIAVREILVTEEQDDTRIIFEEEFEKRTGIGIVDNENKFNEICSRLLFLSSDEYIDRKEYRYPFMGNKRESKPNEFKLIKESKKNIKDFNPILK